MDLDIEMEKFIKNLFKKYRYDTLDILFKFIGIYSELDKEKNNREFFYKGIKAFLLKQVEKEKKEAK